MSKYIIGIDLGTTNCTMAYTSDAGEISQHLIHQMTEAGIHTYLPFLPSFIYFPLDEEKNNWNTQFITGKFARDRGAEVPARLISSAKSWLCHFGINRREKILPMESDEIDLKMSPLEACGEILRLLKDSWNEKMPHDPFEEQQILITVPASFDPSARQLVQEAAEKAGYPEVILLEEPQAAFYAWLNRQGESWRKFLKVGESILVIDIGGGTTDFSLIEVENENGNLALKRKAVGAHLLLGGDNIDLALAHLVKQKFEDQGHSIDHWQLQMLIHQCRQAKEILLDENPPGHIEITLLGRGSRLIGNTLKTELNVEEVKKLILDGFVPLVSMQEKSQNEKKLGLQQVGLPFVSDPRISSQLAKFLSESGDFLLPTAVLFNGGTTKSILLRKQLLEQLNRWANELNKVEIRELVDPDYDFAVSRGAVVYGMSRQNKAIRICGGCSRSYFIGVEEAAPAIPGMEPPLKAVCVVPFGMEEGEERELTNQEFALVLGEQALFRFFSSGKEASIGSVVRNWRQELTELHPIEAMLDKMEGDGKTIRIKLKSKVTELGVLELWCAAEDGRRWKLEFDVR